MSHYNRENVIDSSKISGQLYQIVSQLYLLGKELGIKSFYYQRSENILRQGISAMDASACVSCDG